MKRLLSNLFMTFVLIAPLMAQQPPIIDRELFFGDPEITGAQISPDGKFIAFIKPWNGTRNIWANRYVVENGWGAAELIETNNAGDANSPQIAIDANGNAIAFWEQSDGSNYNIWFNRHDPCVSDIDNDGQFDDAAVAWEDAICGELPPELHRTTTLRLVDLCLQELEQPERARRALAKGVAGGISEREGKILSSRMPLFVKWTTTVSWERLLTTVPDVPC